MIKSIKKLENIKFYLEDLIRNSVIKSIYLKIIESFLLFLTSVFVTRFLGPSNYGKLIYINSIIFILQPLYTLGVNSILQSDLSREKNSTRILNRLLTLQLILFTIVSLISFSIFNLFLNKEYFLIFFILQIAFGFRIFDVFTKSLFIFDKGVESGKIYIISALKLLTLILFCFLLGINIYLIALSYLINYATDLIIIFKVLKNNNLSYFFYNLKIDFSDFKRNFMKGLPITGSVLITMLLMKSDIIIISNFMDDISAGIYSAPIRLVSQVSILLNLISFNLIPKLKFQFVSRPDKNALKLYLSTWLFSLIIAILFFIFSPYIIRFGFGNEYSSSLKLLPLMSIIVFFNGILLTDNAFLNFYNLRSIIFFKTLISLVLNILLNILFIPKFGLQGVLLALLISTIFNSCGGILFKKDLYYHYKNLFLPKISLFKK